MSRKPPEPAGTRRSGGHAYSFDHMTGRCACCRDAEGRLRADSIVVDAVRRYCEARIAAGQSHWKVGEVALGLGLRFNLDDVADAMALLYNDPVDDAEGEEPTP